MCQLSTAVVSKLRLPTAWVRAGGQDPRSPTLLSSAEDITSSGEWGPWTSQSPQEQPFRKEPVDFSVWAEGSTPPGFLRGLPSAPAPARHPVLQGPPARTGRSRRTCHRLWGPIRPGSQTRKPAKCPLLATFLSWKMYSFILEKRCSSVRGLPLL